MTEKNTARSPLAFAREAVRTLRRVRDRFERGSLALQEFTAVLPLAHCADVHALARLLEQLDREFEEELEGGPSSEYSSIPGLHGARFTLLNQHGTPSGPLLFGLVFDGDTEDVLASLVDRMGPALRLILGYTADSPMPDSRQALVRHLEQARVRSGYFFSDVDESQTEIRGALQAKVAFTRFYAQHQTERDPAVLKREFEAFVREHSHLELGYPFALSRFEEAVPFEGRWVRRVVELTRRLQERDARHGPERGEDPRPLRVAHTKHHGCVTARFEVREDLPERFQHGVFQRGAAFDALVRLSNTSNHWMHDLIPDGRGMSIKLLHVESATLSPTALAEPPPDGDGVSEGITQDFLLLSHPVFFSKNIRDFAILRANLDVGTPLERAARLAVFASSRPKETGILATTLKRQILHPFAIEYHSTTPSLLGDDLAVKYSVHPCATPSRLYRRRPAFWKRNYLRAALQASLDDRNDEPIRLEFCVHVSPPGKQLPVEDATVDWDAAGAEVYPVATLTIHPQDCTSGERMELAERLSFTPWHALGAHRPLGSLNRARFRIYEASWRGRRAGARAGAGVADVSSQAHVPSAPPPAITLSPGAPDSTGEGELSRSAE